MPTISFLKEFPSKDRFFIMIILLFSGRSPPGGPTMLAQSRPGYNPGREARVNAVRSQSAYRVDAEGHPNPTKEAAMRRTSIIALAALGLFAAGTPTLGGSGEDPEGMITRAVSVIMDHSGDSKAALVEILDASLLILPKTVYAGKFRSRIESAKKESPETSLFSGKSYKDLTLAYRLVAAGEEFKFPNVVLKAAGEKTGIEKAVVYCQASIDSALSELRAGRRECAARHLVEFVLMVITPIQR